MKVKWNDGQLKILKKLQFSFNVEEVLTEDKMLVLDKTISNHIQLNCIVADKLTDEGVVCESIIDELSDL